MGWVGIDDGVSGTGHWGVGGGTRLWGGWEWTLEWVGMDQGEVGNGHSGGWDWTLPVRGN